MSARAYRFRGLPARELAFGILYAAELSRSSVDDAYLLYEAAFVAERPEKGPRERTEHFEIEIPEDHLPEPEFWQEHGPHARTLLHATASRDEDVRREIGVASPRWRLDRMPAVDRSLIRLGCGEFLGVTSPPTREIINSYIELAKRYGSPTSSAFVNGILDQIRKNLELPFE